MSWRHEVKQDAGTWSAVVLRKRRGGGWKVVASQNGFDSQPAADAWGLGNVEMRERDKVRSEQGAISVGPDEERPDESDRLTSLGAELEALGDGIEVADGRYEGDGVYTLKVRTPTGAYLDSGTRKDWIAQIKGDLSAANRAKCPFCASSVPVGLDEAEGGACGGCGAVHTYSGQSLAADLRIEQSTPTQVLAALASIHECVSEDRRNGRIWGRRVGTFPCDRPHPDLEAIIGPSDQAESLALPVLLDTDLTYENPAAAQAGTLAELAAALSIGEGYSWAEAFGDGKVAVAGCGQCRFAVSSEDQSGHVLGLYWGTGDRTTYCARPLVGTEALPDGVSLDLEEQSARGYRTIETAYVANAMRERVLDAFICVDSRDDGLEALMPELDGTFHGPVCPAFEAQPEGHWADQSLYDATAVTVLGVFGPVDFERRRHEVAQALAAEERQRRLEEARALRDELGRDPELKALSRGSLNAQDARGVLADRIIDFLVKKVDVGFLVDSTYRDWFIGLFSPSNKAKEIMLARIAQEVRARGLVPNETE